MGITKKAKVMFTCEHEIKDKLAVWAKLENRTVSNLVEKLVIDAVSEHEQKTDNKGAA